MARYDFLAPSPDSLPQKYRQQDEAEDGQLLMKDDNDDGNACECWRCMEVMDVSLLREAKKRLMETTTVATQHADGNNACECWW